MIPQAQYDMETRTDAEADGDEARATVLYIRYRITELTGVLLRGSTTLTVK